MIIMIITMITMITMITVITMFTMMMKTKTEGKKVKSEEKLKYDSFQYKNKKKKVGIRVIPCIKTASRPVDYDSFCTSRPVDYDSFCFSLP